ncbi:MAG: hypothetical protein QOJ64_2741 [Acidobacteriota bacterium]|nr:hypothetical protein [Acidobacteriota bacterium]
MKSVAFGTLVLVFAVVVLLACGGKSESERSYADACVKMMKGEAYKKLCECEAGIVASKLTPGELKVYLAWPDMPKTAMSSADLSKFAADHGFTLDDMKGREEKMKTLLPEVKKTCLQTK